jgi:hypothetical protein
MKEELFESKEELFESLLSEDIDDVYTAAYYRADRIVKSFLKDFPRGVIKSAFEHAIEEL